MKPPSRRYSLPRNRLCWLVLLRSRQPTDRNGDRGSAPTPRFHRMPATTLAPPLRSPQAGWVAATDWWPGPSGRLTVGGPQTPQVTDHAARLVVEGFVYVAQ